MPVEIDELIIRARLDGVEAAQRRMEDLGTAVTTTDTAIQKTGKSFEATAAKLDEAANLAQKATRINRDYEASVTAINRAVQVGATTQAEADELTRRAGVKRDQDLQRARDQAAALAAQYDGTALASDRVSKSADKQAYVLRQLGIQGIQTASSLASGMPIMTTLVQQGHQVADIAMAQGQGFGILGAAARAVGSALLSPIGAAVALGGALALTFSHASALEAQTRALSIGLRAVGRDGEIAAGGLQSYVRLLQNGGVSAADATSIIGGLSRNSQLSGAQIGQVAGLTADTATARGADAASTAKLLGEAFGGSYSAIKTLDDELNVLTADQRLAVRVMLEHGERTEAVNKVMEALSNRVKGLNDESLTPAARAFRDMANGWGEFMDRVANSGPVIAAMQALSASARGLNAIISGDATSPATKLAGFDKMIADTRASMVGEDDPALQQLIRQRDAIAAQIAAATHTATPGASAGLGDHATGAGGLPGQSNGVQLKALEDINKALTDQQRIIAAGLPGQARVRAEIEAENFIRDHALSGLAAEEYRRKAVALAVNEEGAARGRELEAILQQSSAEMQLVRAADEGRAAMLRAQAAAEAHAKAITEGGVDEKAFAEAILNRAAAQEAAKGARTLVELNEQLAATRALIDAEKSGDRAAYYAALSEKVRVATVDLRAARDAATDPAIKAADTAAVALISQKIEAQEKLNADLQAEKSLRAGQGVLDDLRAEAGMIGLAAEQRERELAALRATRALVSSGQAPDASSLTDTQRALVEQSRTIASANFALKQQQTLYDGIAQSATQAFDQVGQAISNAFLGGSRAAVNWGNIARSAAASVMQQVIKLGVINPVLNSALGTSLPSASIFSSLGGLGGLFGGGSSSGSGSGVNMNGGGIMPSGNGLTDMLGISNLFGNGPGFLGSSMSLGQIGASFGMGMGLGTLANTLARGNATNGMIGSALGSLLLGPLGGLAGGLIGGIIGPGKAHHGYSWTVGADTSGQLGLLTQNVDSVAQQQFAQEQQQIAAFNAWMKAQGIKASGAFIVGGNNDPTKEHDYANFNTGVSALSFTASNNSALNTVLQGRAFTDATQVQDFATFFTTTMPALIGGQGSVKSAIDGLNKSFTDAIAKATEFGLATDDLAAAQAKQVQAVNDAALLATQQSEAGLQARIMAASGDTAGAGLLNFDTQATAQRASLAKQLTDAFGDAYASTSDYNRIMGELNTALDLERKNLVNAPSLQAAGNVAGVITNLASYTAGLSTSAASPLAPLAQLTSARRGFDAVAGAAIAGDYGSLQQVQAYAQNLLTVSRNVNGSGAAYAADFSHVVDILTRASAVNPDTLTTSAMAALQQNQTDQLKAAIADLQGEVAGLRLDMAQAAATPGRIAA